MKLLFHCPHGVKLACTWGLCFLLFVCTASSAKAEVVTDETLKKITFDQKLNQQIALELQFRDEQGRIVKLGDYFGKRPVILVLGYYGCPMLCTLVLNGMVEGLQDLKGSVGEQFEVVNVSIDPHETPALASAKKKTYLKRYGRAGAAGGWHFLTGDEASIRQLADEVGYRYAYDEKSRQYAHPSGLVILTPKAKVSHYLLGVNFPGEEMNSALKAAAADKVGSPVQQLLMLCFHYTPITGKYGVLVMTVVRICAFITLLLLSRLIFVTIRKDGAKAGRDLEVPIKTG
ncbi:SCO family protein [Pedosphaera parvula]|uniref:Electron transport protein SCO1/SenC n=1 Tax=Pedosphaera parvula (strain Ellin514) TaxID=320771 RepID=B9XE52_PEDPL|nr:SCO family protein [Pedosphaera parvula]EEF61943.1 electron transport protein SCO1/SenC [Pedosphaera parvula Ellin514]